VSQIIDRRQDFRLCRTEQNPAPYRQSAACCFSS
jgi:hypothetical protein